MTSFSIDFKLPPVLGLALISALDFNIGLMAQEKSKKEASKDSTISTLQITLPTPLTQNNDNLQDLHIQAPSPARQDSAVMLEIKIDSVAPSVKKQKSLPTIELKLESLSKFGAVVKDTSSTPEVIELKIAPVKTLENTQKKQEEQELNFQIIRPPNVGIDSKKESMNKMPDKPKKQ